MLLNRLVRSLPSILIVLLLAADGAADPWRVGLAVTKITPEKPIRLAGYASREEPFGRVAIDLHAKAMMLQDAAGNRGLLITTDLIGLKGAITESVCRKITARTGLSREQILINSSHTHTGPALLLDAADVDWPQQQADDSIAYTKWLMQTIVDLGVEAGEKLEPAELAWNVGVATFPMNRREFTERGVRLGENPSGLVDRGVPAIRVESADGKVRCVLFGTACHNTTLGPRDVHISGDFAGHAQSYVESRFDGVQAMFMQNCGGDANPYPRGSESIAESHGESLGAEIVRMMAEPWHEIDAKFASVIDSVELPLQAAPSRGSIEQLISRGSWQGWVGQQMKKRMSETGELPTGYDAPIAVWQLGDDLTLVALPGEVVVGYVDLIGEAIGRRKLWISAYNNDVFGYLPTAKTLAQGGYETRGLYGGGIGFFAPDAETVVVDKVRELAEQVGRDLVGSR